MPDDGSDLTLLAITISDDDDDDGDRPQHQDLSLNHHQRTEETTGGESILSLRLLSPPPAGDHEEDDDEDDDSSDHHDSQPLMLIPRGGGGGEEEPEHDEKRSRESQSFAWPLAHHVWRQLISDDAAEQKAKKKSLSLFSAPSIRPSTSPSHRAIIAPIDTMEKHHHHQVQTQPPPTPPPSLCSSRRRVGGPRWLRLALLLFFIAGLRMYVFAVTTFLVNEHIKLQGFRFSAGQADYAISLTSIPARTFILGLQIQQINQLPPSIRPKEVILNVPHCYKRFPCLSPEQISYIDALNIQINWLERDFGPISKVYGLLAAKNVSGVLVIDDERELDESVFRITSTSLHAPPPTAALDRQEEKGGGVEVVSFSSTILNHLMGSHGFYLSSKLRTLVQDAVDQFDASLWGFEDDLYLTCYFLKHHVTIDWHKGVSNARSFLLSDISQSRFVGLIEASDNSELFAKRYLWMTEGLNC